MNKKERFCDVDNIVERRHIITALLALVTMAGQAQDTFDTDEGCLNVVDFTYGQGIGVYGDICILHRIEGCWLLCVMKHTLFMRLITVGMITVIN